MAAHAHWPPPSLLVFQANALYDWKPRIRITWRGRKTSTNERASVNNKLHYMNCLKNFLCWMSCVCVFVEWFCFLKNHWELFLLLPIRSVFCCNFNDCHCCCWCCCNCCCWCCTAFALCSQLQHFKKCLHCRPFSFVFATFCANIFNALAYAFIHRSFVCFVMVSSHVHEYANMRSAISIENAPSVSI